MKRYRQGMESEEKERKDENPEMRRRDWIFNIGVLSVLGSAAAYMAVKSLKDIDWKNFDFRIKPESSYGTKRTPDLEERTKDLHSVLDRVRDPIFISTYRDFDKMRSNLDEYFRLKNDIYIPKGTSFEPVGTTKRPFNGIFDGQEYLICGIKINFPDSSNNIGLFGVMGKDSIIGNLVLRDIDIAGGNSVGAFVGCNYGGSVLNCSIRGGKIHGSSSTGAFIGHNYNGIIVNPFVYADVSVDQDAVGMIVGTNHEGSIIDPSGEGNVFGKVHVGAIVGSNQGGHIINPNIKTKDREGKLIEKLVGIDHPTLKQNPYETDDSLM